MTPGDINSIVHSFSQLWAEISSRTSQPPIRAEQRELWDLLSRMPEATRGRMLEILGAPDDAFRRETETRLIAFDEAVRAVGVRTGELPTPAPELGTLTPVTNYRFSPGFRLLKELGRGGNGVVFLAELTSAKPGSEPVAVKVFHRSPFAQATMATLQQVEQEQNLHRLTHPGIVRFLTAGDSDRGPFVAMEWVRGESLKAWMKTASRPLDQVTAARTVAALADAVQAIHTRSLIHRDIKPENVLGCNGPELVPADLKLGDFGTSSELIAATGPDAGRGRVEGTPGYMPPEQLAGEENGTADIYALGLVLVFLLTGKTPTGREDEPSIFTEAGRETFRMLQSRLSKPIDPTANDTVRREYAALMDPTRIAGHIRSGPSGYEQLQDAVLRAVVTRCLAQHPSGRYQSAAALAADLERFIDDRATEEAGYEYTVGNHLSQFRRRCFRPEERFDADRRTVWGLAFLLFIPIGVFLELLDRFLMTLGVGRDDSNKVCSAILIVITTLVIAFVWRRMQGKSLVRRFAPAFLAYILAAFVLIYVIFPHDGVMLTTLLLLLFGLFATVLGVLSDSWRHTLWVGVVGILLSPLAHLLGRGRPDLVHEWGASLMGLLYLAFFLLMAAGYINVQSILRAVCHTGRSQR